MNVSVFGLGYVGCVTAACLARNGHYVFGVDVNLDKVDMINDGRAPIVEPGLDDLIRTVVAAGRLRATPDGTAAVKATDLALICVGTPGHGHGQPSFDAIARVGEHIGRSLVGRRQPFTVVLRSTALPGTTESVLLAAIQRTLGDGGPEVYVGCNPEFMREGASIHDFDHPPFVLIGAEDPKVTGQLREMYAGVDGEIVRTSIRSAELVKYASNAFHGLKVCFANEMGDMADALGADAREVMRIFALDRKLNISPAYLKPGFAFGGSCLPKDVRGLLWAGRMQDVDTPVLSAILPSNERQIRRRSRSRAGVRTPPNQRHRPGVQARYRRPARESDGDARRGVDWQGTRRACVRSKRGVGAAGRRQPAVHRTRDSAHRVDPDRIGSTRWSRTARSSSWDRRATMPARWSSASQGRRTSLT
jgi:GDP-mannose 6-dehydrogenase